MKVAHIVCAYPPYYGGMGNTVFETVSRLGSLGIEATVFTPGYYQKKEIKESDVEPEKQHSFELEKQIENVKRLQPSISYGNAARLPQLKNELKDFDLVHLHYPFFGTANLVRKWKMENPEKKLVITYHMDTRAPSWKGLIFKIYAKYWMEKILNSADLLIASSFDYLAVSDAKKNFKQFPDKWIELPFGVDIDRFAPREKSSDLLKRHNLNIEDPILLFVGGMDVAHYFKGVLVLIKSLVLLKKFNFNLQVVLVGDGELRQMYEEQAKFYGVDKMITFVGQASVEELPYYYNLSDLFVLPSTSRGEAFGMVLLEAMSSGVPVIASDLPGVRSLANKGGVIFSVNNYKDLAETIVGFFKKADYSAWSEKARQVALDNYDWNKIVIRLAEAYQKLLS